MLDVAKRAGVSISTVSYVLSGTRPVSEKTKRLIYQTMEELGYHPHALARGLASKRSRIIALLFSPRERGMGLTEIEFVTNAAEAALDRSYSLVLWNTRVDDADHLRELTRQRLVDGVILMEVRSHDERVAVLREAGTPFTMIGRCENNAGLSYADIDFDQLTREVVVYLAGLGHEKIAFLNQSREIFESGYGPAVRAYEGFRKAVSEAGLEEVVAFSHATPADGYECCRRLLADNSDLTALVAMNDRALPGVVKAVGERGWHIPADFSLVSIVSSSRTAELFVPPLTTMEMPGKELGRLGVEQLIRHLEQPGGEVAQVLVPCTLVKRGSSASRRLRAAK